MIMNHVNLAVTDVIEAQKFLEKYFGLKPVPGMKENPVIAVFMDEGGMVLSLSNPEKATKVTYPGSFHIGFGQESPEKVNAINKRLKDDGFDVPPPSKQHGSWTFYFMAPGGYVIEILC
jgi:lactoylglutathione lyase